MKRDANEAYKFNQDHHKVANDYSTNSNTYLTDNVRIQSINYIAEILPAETSIYHPVQSQFAHILEHTVMNRNTTRLTSF